MVNYDDITTLKLTKRTKKRLAGYGKKLETFDDLINRILDKLDEQE